MAETPASRSRVTLARSDVAFLVVVGAAVGGVLGALLDPVSGWAARQDWLPAKDLRHVIDRFADDASAWIQIIVGLLVGMLAGAVLSWCATVIEVTDREIEIVKVGKRSRWARGQVASVALDGRRLVLRSADDVHLVDEKIDGEPADMAAALDRHGWNDDGGGGRSTARP